jgi:hypothetical protein
MDSDEDTQMVDADALPPTSNVKGKEKAIERFDYEDDNLPW